MCLWFIQYIIIMLVIIYIYICCTQHCWELAVLSCAIALIDSFIISLLRLMEAFIRFRVWAWWLPWMVKIKQNKNLTYQHNSNQLCEDDGNITNSQDTVYINYIWDKSQYSIVLLCDLWEAILYSFYIWFQRTVILKLWPTQ